MAPHQTTFKRNAHIAFFRRCLIGLPSSAEGHDGNRITIAYFCLSGLELLGALDKIGESEKQGYVEWVWSLQRPQGGFSGSTYLLTDSLRPTASSSSSNEISADPNPPHLPSTYTALLVLALLRADLSRLNREGLLDFLASCLEDDGSFSPLPIPSSQRPRTPSFESDARMAYCASVILSILSYASHPTESAWEATEKGKGKGREVMVEWLRGCQTWEGGYGQRPVLEAQGGTTYCCTAALHLLSRLAPDLTSPAEGDDLSHDDPSRSAALRFLTHLQKAEAEGGGGGFQGRPGKDEDVCYSFWAGAGIRILQGEPLFERESNRTWLLGAQSPVGGWGKEAGEYPDPYHSYLGLAALSMLDNDRVEESAEHPGGRLDLEDLDPAWNVSRRVRSWLEGEMRRLEVHEGM